MTDRRRHEVISVSLGSNAALLQTHWQNLQTWSIHHKNQGGADACYDATVTHLESTAYNRTTATSMMMIPRCLWIDSNVRRMILLPSSLKEDDLNLSCWTGNVQEIRLQENDKDQTITAPYTSYFHVPGTKAASPSYTPSSDNPRHVDWDAMLQQPEEFTPEQPPLTTSHISVPQQSQQWNEYIQQQQKSNASWMDFMLPLYHPDFSFCHLVESWYENDATYPTSTTTTTNDWEDSLRHWLEPCDACQGLILSTDSSTHATTPILQWFQEEVPSAKRWLCALEEHDPTTSHAPQTTIVNSSLAARQHKAQRKVNEQIFWKEALEEAHMIVPLSNSNKNHTMDQLRHTAAALETATLPYRLRRNRLYNKWEDQEQIASSVGLYNTSSSTLYECSNQASASIFPQASSLSMSELTRTLTAEFSSVHKMVELDALCHEDGATRILSSSTLWKDHLLEGTTLDRRTRQQNSYGQQEQQSVLPGRWMMERTTENLPTAGSGILSSLSPFRKDQDRSQHTHFALVAGLRMEQKDVVGIRNEDAPTDVLLQGMGVRYRPDSSIATILGQTHGEMIEQSSLPSYCYDYYQKASKNMHSYHAPTLAVLGNTTRSFASLQTLTKDGTDPFKTRSRSLRYVDDELREALTLLCHVRDAYEPPGYIAEEIVEEDF